MTTRWWVAAQGRTFGPYPPERLVAFVAEGRLEADSAVAAAPSGPFTPAGELRELAHLFPATDVPATDVPATVTPPPLRPLLVVADLRETDPCAMEQALAGHGESLRLRPGLWLIQARESPASLRNALGRRLKPRDALVVVEAPCEAAAWFNLEGPTDRALRRLWNLSAPQAAERSRA